jgi:hypothetical protein
MAGSPHRLAHIHARSRAVKNRYCNVLVRSCAYPVFKALIYGDEGFPRDSGAVRMCACHEICSGGRSERRSASPGRNPSGLASVLHRELTSRRRPAQARAASTSA